MSMKESGRREGKRVKETVLGKKMRERERKWRENGMKRQMEE